MEKDDRLKTLVKRMEDFVDVEFMKCQVNDFNQIIKCHKTLLISALSNLDSRISLSAAADVCWQNLHSKDFEDVDEFWRILYRCFIVLLSRLILIEANKVAKELSAIEISLQEERWKTKRIEITRHIIVTSHERWDDMSLFELIFLSLYFVDKGLMMAAKNSKLCSIASEIHSLLPPIELSNIAPSNRLDLESVNPSIKTYKTPSLINFKKLMEEGKPFLVSNLTEDWKCLQKWKDFSCFLDHSGYRIVPIEEGASYTHENWSQSLDCVSNFLEENIYNKNESESTKYLAQYEFFDRISEFRDDFEIPKYCSLKTTSGKVAINLWLGPQGTRSPFHFDLNNNLLCQIIGSKVVLLVDKLYGERLKPITSGLTTNTSSLHFAVNQELLFKGFTNVSEIIKGAKETKQILDSIHVDVVILKAGDTLFIPNGCWHHVESLEPSLSLSFWW